MALLKKILSANIKSLITIFVAKKWDTTHHILDKIFYLFFHWILFFEITFSLFFSLAEKTHTKTLVELFFDSVKRGKQRRKRRKPKSNNKKKFIHSLDWHDWGWNMNDFLWFFLKFSLIYICMYVGKLIP